MRIDERGREHEPGRRGSHVLDRGHDAVLDGHDARAVQPERGIDDPRTDRERVARSVAPGERHATSSTGAATWSPGAVSRS